MFKGSMSFRMFVKKRQKATSTASHSVQLMGWAMDHVFVIAPRSPPSPLASYQNSVPRGVAWFPLASACSSCPCRTTPTATATRRGMDTPRTRGSTVRRPWWCLRTARCMWPTWGTSASGRCAATSRPPVRRRRTAPGRVAAWTLMWTCSQYTQTGERVDMITLLMIAWGFESKCYSIPIEWNASSSCLFGNRRCSVSVYHKG